MLKIKIVKLGKDWYSFDLLVSGTSVGNGSVQGKRVKAKEEAQRMADELGFNDGVDF